MTFVLSTLSPRKLACYFGLTTCFAERTFLARKRKKSHPVFSSVCKTILKELHCFFTLAWWGHVPLPLRFAIIITGQHKHHIGHTTYLAKTPVVAHKAVIARQWLWLAAYIRMRIASLAGAASHPSLTDSHCKIVQNELLCVHFIVDSVQIFCAWRLCQPCATERVGNVKGAVPGDIFCGI